MRTVSTIHGWILVGGHALAPGDPCFEHVVAEGLL